jgi:tagatose-6-phosphate ketose/aldose isomerase
MSGASLQSYLDTFSKSDNNLARIVRSPQPDRGLLYTPREIAQQPWLWRETAERMKGHAPALKEFLQSAGFYDGYPRPHFLLTGAGTSHYIGLSLADLLRMHFRTPATPWSSTRLTADPNVIPEGDQRYVIVHFARSGNSPESCAAVKIMLEACPETVRHIIITCNREGDLAQLAIEHSDHAYLVILHEAANDEGLAMTSSFSSMVVAGQALAYLDRITYFGDVIGRVSAAGEYLLDRYTDEISQIAGRDLDRVIFLGNRDLIGAAAESSLKVQELTAGHIMAAAEDTMGFRHGPISAVNARSLVCFFLAEKPLTRRYELDVLHQFEPAFSDIGALTVLVGAGLSEATGMSVRCIDYDPDGAMQIPPLFQVLPATLFGQLFGLFASAARGYKADDPSVDKALYSRTVQGVTIYQSEKAAALDVV